MKIIVAMDLNLGIGYKNNIPWHIPEDLKRFKSLTLNKTVVMGRKTWESILNILGKPLPNRTNVVLTRNEQYLHPQAHIIHSIESLINESHEDIFIIGGADIYRLFFPYTKYLYITMVHKEFKGVDAFFYDFKTYFTNISYEKYYSKHERCFYSFELWQRNDLDFHLNII